jgi:hypothetical protein
MLKKWQCERGSIGEEYFIIIYKIQTIAAEKQNQKALHHCLVLENNIR